MNPSRLTAPRVSRPPRAGFTLVELLMVLAILGIIVGIGLPAAVNTVRKGPMRQAISDLEEGFLKARMLAILTSQPAELVIRAADGSLEVLSVGGGGSDPATAAEPAPAVPAPEAEGQPRREPLPSFSARFHDTVAFKQLVVNLRDAMDEPEVAVRFQPNGTCDAFQAVLFSEAGEQRRISLEITTGRVRVEDVR